MKISFACPSCGSVGSVDASAIGKHVRCKPCGHRFAIPRPAEPEREPEPDVYAMDEAAGGMAGAAAFRPALGSVYVASPGSEPTSGAPKRASPRSASRTSRGEASGFAWRTWLVRSVVAAALILVAVALLAPRGTLIAGLAMVVLGVVMMLLGFGAGAYGAFREDFIYGVFYLVLPLYTAYYIVTRWDDLRPWVALSTAGVALVMLGTKVIEWAGVVM